MTCTSIRCFPPGETVEQICREAVAKNIRLIALTEDDTTASYAELKVAVPRYGLRRINGVRGSDALPRSRELQEEGSKRQPWQNVSLML